MKYKILYHYPNGSSEYDDRLYDTEEEAEEAGCYGCSCYSQGAEIFNSSNPGDYPLDGMEDDCDFEIIEVEG